MAKDTAAGMAYLHKQNVLHRDLSLRNLLATTGNVVKVSDFGLAKAISEENYYLSESKVMPVKWTAPESLEYNKFTYASDVWSFGVTMWELFSRGKVPYPGLNNEQVMEKVTNGYRMTKPQDCPDEVYDLMMKCWDKNPKNRPSFEVLYKEIYKLWAKLKHPNSEQNQLTTELEDINPYAVTQDEEVSYQNDV